MTGSIRYYSERGYGFITGEDYSDVFFHVREFRGDESLIFSTMRVSYELGPSRRGDTEAKNVIPLEVTR